MRETLKKLILWLLRVKTAELNGNTWVYWGWKNTIECDLGWQTYRAKPNVKTKKAIQNGKLIEVAKQLETDIPFLNRLMFGGGNRRE